MTKEAVIKGMVKVLMEYAEKYNLEVSGPVYGHAFDNTIWNFTDDSEIPNIHARGENVHVEIRSFWGSPEIDVRMDEKTNNSRLLVLNYSDGLWNDGEWEHNGNFTVMEVRADGRAYKKNMAEIYHMIEAIEQRNRPKRFFGFLYKIMTFTTGRK